MKAAFAVFLLILVGEVHAQESFVTVDGHRFHYYSKGLKKRKPGEPVLVFENGMGMGLGNWNSVIGELAQTAPVFSYDRAGVEKSEKIYRMPTVREVADNLKSILKTLNIAPPYVLVGHSMGGLYIRGYAGHYPDDVSGLVFLDPADFTETKENWNDIFRQLQVPEKRIDEMLYERLYTPANADSANYGPWSELQVLRALRKTDFAEVASLPVPNVPICFIVGGKFEVPPDRRSKDYDHARFFEIKTNFNIERWKKFIDSSSKGGTLLFLSKSGHYVHHDDPKAVIAAIKMMMESLGKTR
ncbi:Pimeloyl-ACP methyl ester carboxylesterase [Dyadobacter soli]|uniref:Pimeloyl-ACP methyl ester carboxylesterase n=1 Tax=Dyadobacter soli TaxID=659014 RepID=A0A1G7GD11_9BACT|nr:alpha/beta hydrolase [Dyadobacter soli]SDE85973.1 Pimeloyl-ACP methyl ester carboxylesterase [Dyadobacter soli]